MARSLLRLLAGAALLADAYAQDFDPVEDMCSRWSHQCRLPPFFESPS